MARVAALLLLVACALHAQSVEIALTNSGTRAPMTAVPLTFSGPAEYTATTDGAGVGRIANVVPGYYTLRLEASGFLAPPDALAPIQVRDANVRLSFALTPLGKVHGQVLLPDGRPAAGANVTLAVYRGVYRSTTTSDQRGRFTVSAPYGAGRFTLAAAVPSSLKPPDGEDWVVTYYPRVAARADAEVIPLALGAELSGYDIRIRTVPVVRVSGVVRDDAGNPAPRATVIFTAEQKSRQTVTGADGTYRVSLGAGEWTVLPRLKRGDTDLLGFARVTVALRDIEALDLRLEHPFSVSGSVTWNGPPDPKADTRVAVSLVPEPGRGNSREGARLAADGSFRFGAVYPGSYTVLPVFYRPGFYLDSIRLGDGEIFGRRVEFVEGVPPLRIVFKQGAASLRVHVENGGGASVVAIPQQDGLMTLDGMTRRVLASNDGSCQLRELRPGDYYVFAFKDYDGEALKDPLFVSRVIAYAEKVHLDENGSATVSLKVTPWPE